MRISFDQTSINCVDKVSSAYQTAQPSVSKVDYGYALDISGKVTDNEAYGVHGRTAEEMMQAAENEDVTLYRNYMAVMSNSMSDEDYAKMVEGDYEPSDMELDTVVTIVDTIKAELVKAGVSVTGYTDQISMEKLTVITGSTAYASELKNAFQAEDLPLTEENVSKAMEAFHRGKEVKELSDGTKKYMIENKLTPTIEHLYLSSHSGAVPKAEPTRGYFRDDISGYYAQTGNIADTSDLKEQIEKKLVSSGYAVTEQNMEQAMWLVTAGIPVTEENLNFKAELDEIPLPLNDTDLFQMIAAKIGDGKDPGDAVYQEQKSIYRRAADCMKAYEDTYEEMTKQPVTVANVKQKRQLEEIRLRMTVEANIQLIQSGFSIDTAPIEETIHALRDLETQYDTVSSAPVNQQNTKDIFRETLYKTREIPDLPYSALGEMLKNQQEITVQAVYETGKGQQTDYVKAGEAYETMMTKPRADLGDRMKKAFRNVDQLLSDMGVDINDRNRKAVRSLAYNQMELSKTNLDAVKEAENLVTRVVEKMSPTAVLTMIRDGINPLRTKMEDLDQYLSKSSNFTEECGSYSRFLYQLEKNKEITTEEKDSFIGIYRMLHQIDHSDGAAIGALIDARAEVNFTNLLSAIRTGKLNGVDITVTDKTGTLKEAIENGARIDAQIDASYVKTQMESIRTLSHVQDDSIRTLENLEQPVTIDNLLAMDAIRQDGGKPLKKLFSTSENSFRELLMNKDPLNSMTNRDSFLTAYQGYLSQCESLAEESTLREKQTSLDIKAMQLTCKQLHLENIKAAKEEEYEVPQMIDGELTTIHLKLIHHAMEKGMISLSMNSETYGKLSGEFQLTDDVLSGLLTGQSMEAISMLQNAEQVITEKTAAEPIKVSSIKVISGTLNRERIRDDKISNEDREPEQGRTETRKLYQMAGIIIGALREMIQTDGSKA